MAARSAVAYLGASLQLKAADFNRKLQLAQKETRTFHRRWRASTTTLKNAGRTLTVAGGAVVATLGAMVIAAARYGDELAKTSQRTGLAVEALAALKFQAGQAGADFENVKKALKGLADSAFEAARGSATYAESYEKIGVKVTDSTGKLRSMSDLLPEIADRFSTMANGTEKSALAADLFGRSGLALIPLLNAGSEGMADMAAEAEKLGLVISETEAHMGEKFNDALDRTQKSFVGLTREIGSIFLPMAVQVLDKVTPLINSFRVWASENQTLLKWVAAVAGALVGAGGLLLGLTGIVAIAPAIGTALSIMLGPWGLIAAGIVIVVAGLVKFRHAIGSGFLSVISAALGALGEMIQGAAWLAEKVGMQGLSGSLEGLREKLSDSSTSLEVQAAAMLKTQDSAEKAEIAVVDLAVEVEKSADVHKGAADKIATSWGDIEQAVDASIERQKSLATELQNHVAEKYGSLEELARRKAELMAEAHAEGAQLISASYHTELVAAGESFGLFLTTTSAGVKIMTDDILSESERWAKEQGTILAAQTAAEQKHAAEVKAAYSKLYGEVKQTFKDIVVAGMSGDLSGALKNLGTNLKNWFVNTFFVEVLADFAAGLLTPLVDMVQGALKKLTDQIVGWITGLFSKGIGNAVTGAVTGTAGNVAGGAGSVAGTVGSVAGAGITGTVGAVTGVVSAVTGIIGLFQGARQTQAMKDIEHWVKLTSIDMHGLRAGMQDGNVFSLAPNWPIHTLLGQMHELGIKTLWPIKADIHELKKDLVSSDGGGIKSTLVSGFDRVVAAVDGLAESVKNMPPPIVNVKAESASAKSLKFAREPNEELNRRVRNIREVRV